MQKLLPPNPACRVWILFVFFVCRGTAACPRGGEPAGSDAGTPAVLADDPEVDRIFQYFAEDKNPQQRSQAYLWIPPATPTIRAVMVGIHNGLPISILQNQAIRAVCRRHGIAQIIVTESGPVMLKDLNFDVTDPAKTAAYDRILQSLAEVSGHGELVTAPIVPLAHSAYMDFPFDAAMRDPDRCLAAIPIKSGMPDKYAFYAPGGKAKSPDTRLSLRHVPILLVTSGSQETVVWRPYPIYYGWTGFETYRHDHADNPGTAYEPRNELFGACWDMMSGHFDMLPRDYRFVAQWLDVVAEARLPAEPGAPLKALRLCDGWLVDPRVPQQNAPRSNYPVPARYLDFTGDRSQALLAGRSLYLAPAHPAAMKPFVVIHQALLRADKWALGRTVFSSKRQLVIVYPAEEVLLVQTLFDPAQQCSPVSPKPDMAGFGETRLHFSTRSPA